MEKTTNNKTVSVRERLLSAEQQINESFVNRSDAIRMILLAHLCGEHYLLVGTPGVAKTALARAFAKHITEARFFTILLGAFSSPEKVFGPLDIKAFQAGEYKVVRGSKLAATEFAFLDECFKCNSGCLNEMLTVLNEREFEGEKVPLMSCGAATNWPEIEQRTENVAALYDRILLRSVVEDVFEEDDVVQLLEKVDALECYTPTEQISLDELKAAIAEVREVNVSESIRKLLHNVRARLVTRKVGDNVRPGIAISGRRMGQLQKVLRASAWLAGRSEVTAADFEVLAYGLWNDRQEIELVRTVLSSLDADLVAAIVIKIDEVRREFESVKSSGFGAASVNKLVARIESVARDTRTAMEQPVFTSNGRKTVGAAIAPLKAAFIELEARISGRAGK